jgi:prepilin-type N-terminal cleavage/methylation domain-containing protein
MPERGFTLIELLVCIAIIAILATLGLTVYSGTTGLAGDARRMQDINALAKVLEIHRDILSNTYVDLDPSDFQNNVLPYDPKESGITDHSVHACGDASAADDWSNACWYCIKATMTPGYCGPGDHILSHALPSYTQWMICANLNKSPGYYCQQSSQ